MREVNNFCSAYPMWFDISTNCRPPRALRLYVDPNTENLIFRWFSDLSRLVSSIEITNSSGVPVSSVPEFFVGLGRQQYSIPLDSLQPDTYTARVKSLCKTNPFQESSYSQPLEINLEAIEGMIDQADYDQEELPLEHAEGEFEVDLFPNPANASFTILTSSEGFTYRMYDLTGRLVTSGNNTGAALELSTASLAEGVYLLRLETAQGYSKMERVVIKR